MMNRMVPLQRLQTPSNSTTDTSGHHQLLNDTCPRERRDVLASLRAQSLRKGRTFRHLGTRLRKRAGVGRADEAVLARSHELQRAATVAAGDDRLRRGKRLDRDEPIVLAVRHKDDGAAGGEVTN